MKSFLRSASVLAGLSLGMAVAASAADTSFWIEPCSVMIGGCDAGDADLARWALEAWEKASGWRTAFRRDEGPLQRSTARSVGR